MFKQKLGLRQSMFALPIVAAIIVAAIAIAGSQRLKDGAGDAPTLNDMLRAAILAF